MKISRVTKSIFILATVAFVFASCSKDYDAPILTQKHIIYEIKAHAEHPERDGEIILKGSYTDRNGKKVVIEIGEIPFRIELKDVPANVKASFKGYLFSIHAKQIHMTISMKIINAANGKVIFDNESVVDFEKHSRYSITGEEFREKTSFSFQE